MDAPTHVVRKPDPGSGCLVILTGPSGSGKTTLARTLTARFGFSSLVTWTSRTPRPDEQDGVDYHFRSRDELMARVARGGLLEHTVHDGALYGIARSDFRDLSRQVRDQAQRALVVVDRKGAKVLEVECRARHTPYALVTLAPARLELIRRHLLRFLELGRPEEALPAALRLDEALSESAKDLLWPDARCVVALDAGEPPMKVAEQLVQRLSALPSD